MNGKVGEPCVPPAASCASGFFRLMVWSVNLRPASRKVPSLGGTDYRAPMLGFVDQLAARQAQVALPGRLPMNWPLIAINGHLMATPLNFHPRVRPEDAY